VTEAVYIEQVLAMLLTNFLQSAAREPAPSSVMRAAGVLLCRSAPASPGCRCLYMGIYSATKAAVENTGGMARYSWPAGIDSTILEPSVTRMTRSWQMASAADGERLAAMAR